ncbi:hypothetical protein [Mesorhizobium sp. ANAO-SY3R2]|uniref:hypothetical protein n=1 Tax=Mesorhizobium sp. ANAO-SY3R2 TaxID=3166644 RepID=UPI00366B83F7
MTIKLGNLADWRVLDGKSLAFTAPHYDAGKARKVRLDLNSEFGCNWYIKAGEDERFLAVVPAGLQTLEFVFDGDFELMPVRPDECEIQYWTSEAEEYWSEGDGETFSTIYERQPRNEALEYVMFQAAQNQLRRDKAHAAELASIRAEIGAMNERQSGVHGGAAAQHQEPVAAVQPNAGEGARPAAGDAGGPGAGVAVPNGANQTPQGENK